MVSQKSPFLKFITVQVPASELGRLRAIACQLIGQFQKDADLLDLEVEPAGVPDGGEPLEVVGAVRRRPMSS